MGRKDREVIKEKEYFLKDGQFVMTEEGIFPGPQLLVLKELPGNVLAVVGLMKVTAEYDELKFPGTIENFEDLIHPIEE